MISGPLRPRKPIGPLADRLGEVTGAGGPKGVFRAGTHAENPALRHGTGAPTQSAEGMTVAGA